MNPRKDEDFGDTPEQIDKCLNCKWNECINCIDSKSNGKGLASSARRQQVLQLTKEGKTVAEIADALNLTRQQIWEYRRRLGITDIRPNKKEPEHYQAIRHLHAQGMTDRQIAEAMGSTVSTVNHARHRMGLPINQSTTPRGRKKKN